MICMQHWDDIQRAEHDRIACPVQGVFEKLQDCFADLKGLNCEGYLKRPANNSRQLHLYGMLNRLPEKYIPEFSDPYEHKL